MNTRSTHPTETPFAFLWATFFTLLFLFLSGYGLIFIIHFALEDALSLPISHFLATELFGFEYATFLSYGLILGVMFLAGDFYTRYRLKRNPTLFAQPERRALFATFFAVISYVFCIDLISIFYGFLSGRTGPLGLWLSVSTLILSTLTLGYIYPGLCPKFLGLSGLWHYHCLLCGAWYDLWYLAHHRLRPSVDHGKS